MHVPRFIFRGDASPLAPDTIVSLEGDELHHLRDVFRVRPGDHVEIVAPAIRTVVRANVESIDRERALLRVEEVLSTFPLPPITLLLGMPKGAAAELVVEKCTEIGVSTIVLFGADRTQNPEGALAPKRIERLLRVAESAVKQCGGAVLPEIVTARNLDDALRDRLSPSAPGFVLVSPLETSQATEVATQILTGKKLADELEGAAQDADFSIVVGPEGGLTAREVENALRAGCRPVSLGPQTLRAETAAVLASGLFQLLRRR